MRKEPPANSSDDDPTRRRVVGRESPEVSSPKAGGEEAAGSGAEPESLNFEDLGLFEGGFVFSPGEIVASRFRIVRFLATGGMGELYEAEDLELHERVALKTILPQIAANERSILMFMREVHLARQVTHPNVCRIFDVYRHRPELAPGAGDRAPDVVFLAMELLKGESLADR